VAGSDRPIAVLLVDDHQLLVDALSRILGGEPDIEIAGVAHSVADVRGITGRLDVTLMDYRLPDGTGAEATRIVKARWPSSRVVMLTAISDDETVLESIQAGADGYMTKDRAIEDVVQAVRAAHAGEILLPRAVVFGIAQRVAMAREQGPAQPIVETLTPRESEILRALVEGMPSRTICERLFISPNTLRTHIQNIMGKLRVHSKLEAVAFALRHGLVEPPRSETLLGGTS
jgi:DNA-binding NarL/FixJ family response regulator